MARKVLALWAIWTAVGLVIGFQIYLVDRHVFGVRIEWWRPFLTNVLCYQFWVLFTPLVLALSRRHPLDAGVRRNAFVHAAGAVVVPCVYLLVCQAVVFGPLRSPVYKPTTLGKEVLLSLAANFPFEALTYLVVVGVEHAVRISRERRDRAVAEARNEARLLEARLAALTLQIRPHFLFNALNAVSALLHEDPEKADRTLARLADLLRRTLDAGRRPEVALGEELELLDRYLEIERTRFPDRLRDAVDVPEELRAARVPPLLLQPLAENAIRHGLSRRSAPGRLSVTARAADARLTIRVENDGAAGEAVEEGAGIGLANVRERLAALYGADGTLDIERRPDGGALVTVTLPLRRGDAR